MALMWLGRALATVATALATAVATVAKVVAALASTLAFLTILWTALAAAVLAQLSLPVLRLIRPPQEQRRRAREWIRLRVAKRRCKVTVSPGSGVNRLLERVFPRATYEEVFREIYNDFLDEWQSVVAEDEAMRARTGKGDPLKLACRRAGLYVSIARAVFLLSISPLLDAVGSMFSK